MGAKKINQNENQNGSINTKHTSKEKGEKV